MDYGYLGTIRYLIEMDFKKLREKVRLNMSFDLIYYFYHLVLGGHPNWQLNNS